MTDNELERYVNDSVSIEHGGEVLVGPEGTRLVNISDREDEVDVYIDRRSDWGNPFKLEKDGGEFSRQDSVMNYATTIRRQIADGGDVFPVENIRGRLYYELRQQTLGCWCLPKLCHGVVLMNIIAEMVIEE